VWCPAMQLLNPRGPGFVMCAFGHHTPFAWVSCAYINCVVAFYFATIAIVYTGLWCLYCDSLNYHYCDWLCFLYIHIMLYIRFLFHNKLLNSHLWNHWCFTLHSEWIIKCHNNYCSSVIAVLNGKLTATINSTTNATGNPLLNNYQ